MKFRPWTPKGKKLPVRFYLEGSTNGAYIGKKQGSLKISNSTINEDQKIRSFLLSHQIDIDTLGLTDLGEQITAKRLHVFCSEIPNILNSVPNVVDFKPSRNKSTSNWTQPHRGQATQAELYQESLQLDISSAPFKAATIEHTVVTVDTREPEELYNLMLTSKIKSVGYGSLPLADIQIEDTRTGDILLIERKVISDFHKSILNNHAHDQGERYYNAALAAIAEGKKFRVIWIIESQQEGREGLYHSLPQIKMVDGMINYLDLILGQSVFQSFSLNHTAYLTNKFIQGFIEQELYYKVKTGNPLVNRNKKDRQNIHVGTSGVTDHGVTRASNNLESMLVYLPSIRLNVARELATLGKSYKDIISMTVVELEAIKGVGKKTALEIHSDFNKM
ncbi:hypothetical protein [Moritella sp. F3]|uniref:hypothetical protein n=1 Tax=Moritella sp. F3 TaxID=2718882 RepID=UPI0018E153D4|nr:hypothetical protein [Moritella sp. F3]GIC77675.1 hypothetical protein FMO001_24020 [Moritella sp. F1]GIC82088.1 hypothetical protein FMO003_23690 [Moritella sp. F3]